MRKGALALLLLATAGFARPAFKELYRNDYQDALRFIKEERALLLGEIDRYRGDRRLLISIVFPELVRYSIVSDSIETLGLKVFYVNLGADYANFSIGRFQMKPSFIEILEKHALGSKGAACREATRFAAKDVVARRRERTNRLEDMKWQLRYLSCFFHVTNARFRRQLKRMNQVERVRFFASAYNCGFYKSFTVIKGWQRLRFFPYGQRAGSNQYSYTDIAEEYFRERGRKL